MPSRRDVVPAAVIAVLAAAAFFALRQDHLYRDGAMVVRFVKQDDDPGLYRSYYWLLRRLRDGLAALGVQGWDSQAVASLGSALCAGVSLGLTFVCLRLLRASTGVAVLLVVLIASAPGQVFHATIAEKRTIIQCGATVILAVVLWARAGGPLWIAAPVTAAALLLHDGVAPASLPALAWFALGPRPPGDRAPGDTTPGDMTPGDATPGAAWHAVGVAVMALASVAGVLFHQNVIQAGIPFAAHYLEQARGIFSIDGLRRVPYLLLELFGGLGIMTTLALIGVGAWRPGRGRALLVLAAALPLVVFNLHEIRLYEDMQVLLPDAPLTRAAYLMPFLPVLACLALPLVTRIAHAPRGVVLLCAAAAVLHGGVVLWWWRDRGESWPEVVRRADACIAARTQPARPPIVLYRSSLHCNTAIALAVRNQIALSLETVAFREPLDALVEARRLNESARQGLAEGGAVLIGPGVLEFLDQRGAGAARRVPGAPAPAREALLDGLTLRAAPDDEAFRWLELAPR